jgi:hypothetical protein
MERISALCSRRSTSETTQKALGLAAPPSYPHSANGRLVVITVLFF